MTASEVDRWRAIAGEIVQVRSAEALEAAGFAAGRSSAVALGAALAPVWAASAVEVADVRVNGPRIDVRVIARDAAWLVVLWMEGDRSPAVRQIDLYERPPAFEPTAGIVVVLNGPSSVGKSTLMRTFAETAPEPWACMDEPFFGRLSTRFLAWPESRGPVVDGFLAALAAAAGEGNRFVVSAGGIGQDRFRTVLAGIDAVYVGLNAPIEVLLERQVTQIDKFGGLAEESVGIHAGWEYDVWIDTSDTGPEDAARILAGHLRSWP